MFRLGTTVIRMDTPIALGRAITAEIRAGMESAGISQRDMAEATTIPLVTLNRRLTGNGKALDMAELAAIAEVLGTSVTDLIVRAEARIQERAA